MGNIRDIKKHLGSSDAEHLTPEYIKSYRSLHL